jgi:pimeloyl-ACP methyl ester carboxylesterase
MILDRFLVVNLYTYPMDDRTETLPGDPPCTARHRYAVVNGVRLHYVEAGDGPLVVLLHGFPEFWYSWHRQIPFLAAAGFRVLAPDLRGYNESDKPAGVASYRIEVLTADVAGLIAHAGYDKAHVVGHDWGGAIAWALAMRNPEVVDRLVVLNAPHPAAFIRELGTLEQKLRSWYVLFFQLPGLPELLLRANNYSFLDRVLLRQPVHAGAFSADDVRLYKQALSRPGALTAALNYYRAVFRHRRAARSQIRPIAAPTLLLWGERDRYLGLRLTEGLQPWVPHLRVERFHDASHWVQDDVADKVNRALAAFLRPSPSSSEPRMQR